MPLSPETITALLSFVEKALAACVGSGFGAWAAFRSQEMRERKKQRDDQLNALREAISVLASQLRLLLNLDDQLMTPRRENPARHLLLRPMLLGQGQLHLDLSKLVFLIKLHESGSLISQLEVTEARFQRSLALAERRDALHNSMQDRVDAAQAAQKAPVEGEGTLEDAVMAIVGRRANIALKQATDQFYEAVSDALESIRTSIREIQEFWPKAFPKTRIPTVREETPGLRRGPN